MASILKRQSSNSSSDDDEIDCPLSGSEALTACKEFASVTGTDTGLAMMMLQNNNWNLQQAIAAYQGKSQPTRKKRVKTNTEAPTVTVVNQGNKRFKLLSWNIDGLDEQENTIDIRTRGVINVIKREEPEVIFLQEVVPISYELIKSLLPEYDSYAGNNQGYFVVILLRRERFQVENHEIVSYPGTNMERNLLIVHAKYKDSLPIDFMTSHHESGTEEIASQQRIEQLKLCFQYMLNAPADRFVLFGGDLNVREKELQKAGGIPNEIVDLWIATGKRKECAYTWDMNRNTNVYYPSNEYRPRARFDRLYYRRSKTNHDQLKPVYFELEGLEKLPSLKRYCSDHWAIQAYFDM